jgi:hypothetical protein
MLDAGSGFQGVGPELCPACMKKGLEVAVLQFLFPSTRSSDSNFFAISIDLEFGCPLCRGAKEGKGDTNPPCY